LVPRFVRSDRKSLLLGTALASTFLIGSVLAPTPALAVQNCILDFVPFVPINHTGINDSINCLNFLPRTGIGVDAIGLSTINDDATLGAFAEGISALARGH
jgi:hypothetical protein